VAALPDTYTSDGAQAFKVEYVSQKFTDDRLKSSSAAGRRAAAAKGHVDKATPCQVLDFLADVMKTVNRTVVMGMFRFGTSSAACVFSVDGNIRNFNLDIYGRNTEPSTIPADEQLGYVAPAELYNSVEDMGDADKPELLKLMQFIFANSKRDAALFDTFVSPAGKLAQLGQAIPLATLLSPTVGLKNAVVVPLNGTRAGPFLNGGLLLMLLYLLEGQGSIAQKYTQLLKTLGATLGSETEATNDALTTMRMHSMGAGGIPASGGTKKRRHGSKSKSPKRRRARSRSRSRSRSLPHRAALRK
jgi:hypothetical protein